MKAKRSLGQNFLQSRQVVTAIVKAAEPSGGEVVLEIGPGRGILTRALLERGVKVVAVEKDDKLYEQLKQRFTKEIETGKLELIHDDIFNYDLAIIPHMSRSPSPRSTRLGRQTYKLVANIPYNITGLLLRKFLTTEHKPESMTLMVQKEVASRIVGTPFGDPISKLPKLRESVLSISVKVYGEPSIVAEVGKENFKPIPKVDSAILTISNISDDFFRKNNIEEKNFFAFVRVGYSSPRRQLVNNLKATYQIIDWPETLEKCGLNPRARAENLSKEDWICLMKKAN